MFSLLRAKCASGHSQGKSQKVTLFQGTLTQTSKKFILRALINFHYVTFLPISVKKYLIIINQHPMFSMLRGKKISQGSVRAVSGQIFMPWAFFIWHRRFPYSGHTQGKLLITRHSTDTEDFRTQGSVRALRALRAHFETHLYIYIKIYKFIIDKIFTH